jgi:hypothetical protein
MSSTQDKIKNGELAKIEFLVPTKDKELFQTKCKEKFLGMASVMKELFYKKMEEMK